MFVTGTGTGVGKSIVAAALCASLIQQGRAVLASKPVLSGLDESPSPPWPHDHELLALVTGDSADAIAPLRFGPPVSPHLAARLEGTALSIDAIADGIRARYEQAAERARSTGAQPFLVVEGAGGLLVPISDGDEVSTMAALARELELPLLVAASAGLGTINHVGLTLESARARSLDLAGVVLTPWPSDPGVVERDNLAFLTKHAGTPVRTLEPVAEPTRRALAAAGMAAGLHRLV